jgi:hypothetical protein
MTATEKVKSTLDQKLKKVRETPAGFPFFVSLHDFVEYIESTPSFAVFFKGTKRGSRASEISVKYALMKQIYQGIEDIDIRTKEDLGHDRYVAIRELRLIRDEEVSENNAFWKHREFLRKMAGDIHKTLQDYLAESEVKN